MPYHCLNSIWSQRDEKGKEHLAPSVRATVAQFDSVVSCVVSTCLGDRSMTARDRASVLQRWIEVAGVSLPPSPAAPLATFLAGGPASRDPCAPLGPHLPRAPLARPSGPGTGLLSLSAKLRERGWARSQAGGHACRWVGGRASRAAEVGCPDPGPVLPGPGVPAAQPQLTVDSPGLGVPAAQELVVPLRHPFRPAEWLHPAPEEDLAASFQVGGRQTWGSAAGLRASGSGRA